MECRQCAASLDRPGDFCLTCRTTNADVVVVELATDRARVTTLYEDRVVGAREVTTTPEPADSEARRTERRNFVGLVADEVHRKRPDEVYVTGEREPVGLLRAQLPYELYRVTGEDPIEQVRARRDDPALEVVEASVEAKLGGTHSTLIGGRDGRAILEAVAAHPHVKKIIPGPIDASGASARGGVRGKATRADATGNVRLLVRDGSSVQENRVVTTAGDREMGETVRADLNAAIAEADLGGD